MLEPNQRQHLLQALRPPEGYELSFAIGTTYSLDLTALLSVPLAFAQFDWEDESGRPAADPLALLESLRRYADKLHIFCQAGCIAVPSKQHLLFGYLETSVFQVQAPLGGVFHPKVWVLRFTTQEKPAFYRFLCLSRNLTFDHSWDTILALEGEVADRQRAYAAHHPLGDFIQALPGLAQSPLPDQARKNIELAQHELRRVEFAFPDGFKEYRFWPLGIQGYTRQWPFDLTYDRMLVVSPFLAPDFLKQVTEQGANHVLMSRLDSLSALRGKELNGFKTIYALNPMAEIEEPDTEVAESIFFETALSGLHAKLYVADVGWDAHVWTGSANATNAAFNQNVEFLVELVGKRSVCGVEQFLENSAEHSKFADLWQEFTPTAKALQPDPLQKQLEERLRLAQTALVSAHWQGKIQPAFKEDEFLLELEPKTNPSIKPDVEIQYWPLTLSPALAVSYQTKNASPVVFGPFAVESITAFIVFQLTARKDERSMKLQFVLHIPVSGLPENRRERLLRAMLKNRDQVMRFLLFILADGQSDVISGDAGALALDAPNSSVDGQNHRSEPPLFESLVQALYRDPTRLDQIARTIADLELTSEGQQLLPPDFHVIWDPVWEARQRLVHE